MKLGIVVLVVALFGVASCAGRPSVFSDANVTPSPFAPGIVSTEAEEYRIAFTADGRTAYFARGTAFFPISRAATIYETTFRDGAWSTPTVASFSGQYPDIDPFISPDGRLLLFSSIRPVAGEARKDLDLWVAVRTVNGWSEPRHLGAAVNSPRDELYPSVDASGMLYFGSDREGGVGGWDIYRSTVTGRDPDGIPQYASAENVGAPVNTSRWEFNPAISTDGNTLIFTGLNYPGGAGFGDLYEARRTTSGWSTPTSLPSINTSADEYHASLTSDGRTLLFVRRPPTQQAHGDLMIVRRP